MAAIVQRQIGMKDCGSPANVPNNDVARLMYYFNCVCGAVECDKTPEMQRLSNYANYAYLSANEVRLLISLCYLFSPDVFEDKVFFQSDALCKNNGNKFYEISQVSNQILAVRSIVIAGRQRQVKKIMTYKMSRMRYNYVEPMLRLAQRYGA